MFLSDEINLELFQSIRKKWLSDNFCGRDEQVLPNSIRSRCPFEGVD